MKVVGLAITAIVIAVALAVANYVHSDRIDQRSERTDQRFEAFRSGICELSAGQGRTNQRFYHLVGTLEKRALAREAVDKTAGNGQAAAADADSARLYAAVLAGVRGGSAKGVKQLCG